jgi:hypothetical protein
VTEDYLTGIMAEIDHAYEKAEAEVHDARQRLREAEARFATIKALKAAKDAPAGRTRDKGTSASKANGKAVSDAILGLLRERGTDVPVAEVIDHVAPGADTKGRQAVRNRISAMLKNRAIERGANNSYRLPS